MRMMRFIGILSFSLLYCFNISSFGGNSFRVNDSFKNTTGSESAYSIQEISSHPIGQISQETNHLITGNPTSKETFKNWAVSGKIEAQLQTIRFYQYNFYSRYLSTSFENTDIIYPFHYFW